MQWILINADGTDAVAFLSRMGAFQELFNILWIIYNMTVQVTVVY